MADYEHEYSNYPDELITKKSYKNVNSVVGSIIQDINALRLAGRYGDASKLIKEHPELDDYIFDAVTINTIIEEIYNTQVLALRTGQKVYVQDGEPVVVGIDDIWLGGAKS